MNDNTTTITLDDLLFASVPSSARNIVIEASVTIERVIGIMLARFLDINVEVSKSFGMTPAALSFNHKINLLTDMEIIDKNEKTILIKFSEIRNLFAHNAVVINFSNCFEHNGLKKFLIDKYGTQKSKFDFEEENCKMLFEHLYSDVKQMCRNLFKKMMNRAGSQGETTGKLLYHESLMDKIEELAKTDSDFRKKINQIHNEAITEIDRKK